MVDNFDAEPVALIAARQCRHHHLEKLNPRFQPFFSCSSLVSRHRCSPFFDLFTVQDVGLDTSEALPMNQEIKCQ